MPVLSLLREQPLQLLPVLASDRDVQVPRPCTSGERDNDKDCATTPNNDNQQDNDGGKDGVLRTEYFGTYF